jgi:hypothetical protein
MESLESLMIGTRQPSHLEHLLIALIQSQATTFDSATGTRTLERRVQLPERLRPKGRMVRAEVIVFGVVNGDAPLECGFRYRGRTGKTYPLSPGEVLSLLTSKK